MPPSFELVVCITSTALFDCSESHELWKCDRFLSTEEKQVRKVLSGSEVFEGIAAGLVCNIMSDLVSIESNST